MQFGMYARMRTTFYYIYIYIHDAHAKFNVSVRCEVCVDEREELYWSHIYALYGFHSGIYPSIVFAHIYEKCRCDGRRRDTLWPIMSGFWPRFWSHPIAVSQKCICHVPLPDSMARLTHSLSVRPKPKLP